MFGIKNQNIAFVDVRKESKEDSMSIRNAVAEIINELRKKIEVWDSSSSTTEEKGKVLAELVGDNPVVWEQIAKVASRKLAKKKSTASTITAAPALPAPKPAMTAPAPGTILIASAPKPVPQVAGPARTLRVAPLAKPELTLIQKRDRFVNTLRQFVQDGGHVDGIKTRGNIVGMLESGVELESKHFAAIFAAAKKAHQGGFYIIDKNSTDIFYRAPVEMIDDYVFGQDGEMIQVLAGLNEVTDLRKAGKIVARTYVMLDALDAMKKASRLGEFETSRVETLLATVKRLGHAKLAEEIDQLLSSSIQEELEKVHLKAMVENHPFAVLTQMVS